MTLPNKKNSLFLSLEGPWEKSVHPIWLGSTILLLRNIEKFNFPEKLNLEKQQQILSVTKNGFLKNPFLKKGKIIQAEALSANEKEFLSEHFLSNENFLQTQAGQAFVIDETGQFLATLNLKDHLVLQMIDPQEDLENTWNHLVKIENHLNASLNFSFSPRFGFLTSDLNQCGTGLIVHIFLHLPALCATGNLETSIQKIEEEGITQTGLQGDPNAIIGDIVVFHNLYSLGLTEEAILSSMRTLATKLSAEEKTLRQQLKKRTDAQVADIKDKVSRAYGILLHSYQIEAVEALQALSLVKLGLDLGWIKGAAQSHLNSLFFSCRRAHLSCQSEQPIPQEEIPHQRAAFIHQALKGIELLI